MFCSDNSSQQETPATIKREQSSKKTMLKQSASVKNLTATRVQVLPLLAPTTSLLSSQRKGRADLAKAPRPPRKSRTLPKPQSYGMVVKEEPNQATEDNLRAEKQIRNGRQGQLEPVVESKLDVYIQGFELGRIIGSGMIGLAYVAKNVESGELFCLKCMSKEKIAEKNLVKNIQNEIQFHLDLIDVPNVMPLLKLIVAPLEIVLVYPFIPGRDLFRFMRQKEGASKGHLSEYES